MRRRFGHATHVVRVATLFLAGFTAFLIAHRAMIPDDFGTLGFYRAGALDDARARPIAYAGRAACEECHGGLYDRSEPEEPAKPALSRPIIDREKDNRHAGLGCESCHEPLAYHIDDLDKPVPEVASDKLCLGCHLQLTGRPAIQPQVVAGDHVDKVNKANKASTADKADNDKCVSCHRPHRPRTDEEGD